MISGHFRLGSLLLANVKIYKHIPGIGNSPPDRLSDLMKTGARPLQARVDVTESPTSGTSSSSDDNRFSDLGFADWDGIRPEHVQDLTYLEVGCHKHNVGFPSLVSKSRQLFGDDLLPALTELCIECSNDPLLFSDLFSQLTSATSLRILHIYDEASSSIHAEEQRIPAALLCRHVFPIRFELLCWQQSQWIGTSYFRFLPDDLENERSIHPAAARMGKIGRLQAVPERTALIQVSKDGVWHDM
ncbi:unnamed protein product [Tilletia controversa]|uniref:Uncharacterized protein n=3 Tax=Tilletia TaxID=13289 RepID=A0A8X7SYG2_9BASI|nr:hypothetical protein A4X06_0g3125 [Tilletia controversa]CAD6884312.1 unnamed protein product [Tilletia caries]CAD6912923.1 unnamed protein product [Tilletia laevis]CAD6898462.1 unnamed protein product [Tilletia controversa]CAD6905494.1 unnamed protein product [Tilletia controversa]